MLCLRSCTRHARTSQQHDHDRSMHGTHDLRSRGSDARPGRLQLYSRRSVVLRVAMRKPKRGVGVSMRVSTRVVKTSVKALSSSWRQAHKRGCATAAKVNVTSSRSTRAVVAAATITEFPAPRCVSPWRTKAAVVYVEEAPAAADSAVTPAAKAPRKRRAKKAAAAVVAEEPAGPPLPPLTAETLPAGVAHIAAVDAGKRAFSLCPIHRTRHIAHFISDSLLDNSGR